MILSELDLINVARSRLPNISAADIMTWVSVILDKNTRHWLGTDRKFANVQFQKLTIGGVLQWSYVGYSLDNHKTTNSTVNLPTMAILYDEWRKNEYEGSLAEFINSIQGKDGINATDGFTTELITQNINGSNATFLSEFEFIPETLIVFVNGLKMTKVNDYQTSGSQTILFNSSPEVGDLISIQYFKQ